ncbi:hypothetical protein FKP32DRAFT_1603325 [Trametes sanguinea]|nr:hypothetical protein FKP32DRAFT_1603325 [Trametes sanguinea]
MPSHYPTRSQTARAAKSSGSRPSDAAPPSASSAPFIPTPTYAQIVSSPPGSPRRKKAIIIPTMTEARSELNTAADVDSAATPSVVSDIESPSPLPSVSFATDASSNAVVNAVADSGTFDAVATSTPQPTVADDLAATPSTPDSGADGPRGDERRKGKKRERVESVDEREDMGEVLVPSTPARSSSNGVPGEEYPNLFPLPSFPLAQLPRIDSVDPPPHSNALGLSFEQWADAEMENGFEDLASSGSGSGDIGGRSYGGENAEASGSGEGEYVVL